MNDMLFPQCSNSQISSLPVLPCCLKKRSKKKQETIRHKDNSNMTAACSLQMLSEETYCLSDIIKELEMPSSLHKKRKHDENYLLSIKKKRSNTTISSISMETDDVSLATQNVSMATNTVSMVPAATNSVSLSTRYVSVATNTDSVTQEHEQEDDSVVLEDDSSVAVSPVSMSTHDVPAVVMIGAETQCVSISTDGDGLEIVDEITSPTPKITELHPINDYPFTTNNMESNDSNQKDSNTDSMEPSNNSTEEEHNSTDYYHETNFSVGLNEMTNNSNDELNSEHSEVHVEETQKQSSKKESIEDKPKRGRGRPRKRRYFPAPASEDLNSVKGETQVETLTNSEPGSVLSQAQAERPNSLALSSTHDVHSREQTEYVATKSTTPSESENIDKPKPKRGRGRPRKRTGFPLQFIRKLAPPVSLPATENLNSTANVDNEVQVENSTRSDSENLTMYTQAECPISPEIGLDIPSSTHEGHVNKGEPVKYTTTSSSSTLESEIVEVVGEAGAAKFYLSSDNQDVSSANLGSSGTNTTSSQPVLNEASDSSSVLLTVSDSKATSTVKRPRGRPRKVLLPDDLPTMVSLPTFESQAASPLSSVVQPSKSVDNTVTAESATTIKFVSDTSLHVRSGTMFFYPQNSKQTTPAKQTNIKNLESIADSLKDISGKTVRGDSSVQAVAWLINVLSELDVKKDSSKTVNKGDNQVNGGIKDVCPVKPSSSHAPPLLPKPSPCSSSAVGSTICNANERIHHSADVQSTQPVKIVQPAVTTVQPQCAQHALAEVHASYIDVSWRIVTSSNGKNSTSLKSFYKLVPVRVEQDNGACSFLGVPVYSNTQVISKLLNTSVPEEDNGVFGFEHRPNVTRRVASGLKQPAVTLSFEWVDDTVSIMPIYDTSKHLSNEGNPLRIDSVGLQLPKPLKLPKEGCKVYLGDFQVVSNDVKFVVYHTVTVSKTPRPYLSIPAEALAKSSSATQTTRCRVVGIARNDVHISKGIPVEKPAKPPGKRLSRRCHFCGADLSTLRDIRYHRKIHPSPMGVKCSECPRRFLTVNRLSVHIVKHTCQVLYKCEVCSKQFIPPNLPVEKECIKHHLKLCQTCRAKRKCSKCGVKRRKITVAQQTRSRIKVH